MANTNSKQHPVLMERDKARNLNTNCMVILETCQKQAFDIIAITPRGTLGLCYAHICRLMTHLAVYTTVYLTVMLQASWHTVEGN